MEIKANYLIVGLCTVLAVFIFAGLMIFSSKTGKRTERTQYVIEFVGDVSGLSTGNDVRLNGIKIGYVKSIKISREDPNTVTVIIDVLASAPIKTDSEAFLSTHSLTGVASISITGGTAQSQFLTESTSVGMPKIKSVKSTLEHFISEAPNFIYSATILIENANALLSTENKDNISSIIKSLAITAENISRQSQRLDVIMSNIETASKKMNVMFDNTNILVTKILPESSDAVKVAFTHFNNILTNVEPGISNLAEGGIEEIYKTLAEMRMLLRNANNMLQRIDNNPRRFFFGDNLPEFEVK